MEIHREQAQSRRRPLNSSPARAIKADGSAVEASNGRHAGFRQDDAGASATILRQAVCSLNPSIAKCAHLRAPPDNKMTQAIGLFAFKFTLAGAGRGFGRFLGVGLHHKGVGPVRTGFGESLAGLDASAPSDCRIAPRRSEPSPSLPSGCVRKPTRSGPSRKYPQPIQRPEPDGARNQRGERRAVAESQRPSGLPAVIRRAIRCVRDGVSLHARVPSQSRPCA